MELLSWVLPAIHTFIGLITAGHALLYKRDPRAALGWIAVCLMIPLIGPILYGLFGINRVRTRARELDRQSRFRLRVGYERSEDESEPVLSELEVFPEISDLVRVGNTVTRRSLVSGNRIDLLHNGEQAYPPMLEAIEGARQSLFLTTYIFETNVTGLQFIDALGRAAERGVDVRVMIDGIGEWYSLPRAGTLLKRRGVRVARFLPPTLFPPTLHINLRNHRKILVTDGRIGFTGGMNIGDRHLAERPDHPSRVIDAHFQLTGPIVAQIEQVFLADWGFATKEYPPSKPVSAVETGNAICRTIIDGPNEDLDKLTTILMGAISTARKRVLIMTPYFLPSRELIATLQTAALRGIEVTIILPEKSNLPYVDWATRNMLWELLRWGVRIYYQPPPFAHTKLFLVDDYYAQIGSANIDTRSLRLNFELVVEVYDKSFVAILTHHIDEVREHAREASLKELDDRSLPIRTRDALAWLFSPYL